MKIIRVYVVFYFISFFHVDNLLIFSKKYIRAVSYTHLDVYKRQARNIRHLSNPDAETIPIIAMTANAFDDDIEKSKAAGMDAHLAKPIEPERLFQTLYDFIFGKEA